MTEPAESALQAMGQARLAGGRIDRAALPSLSEEADAYRLQWRLHDWFQANRLGQRVGWKVGATTAVMQDLLAIDHPCAGGVMSGRTHTGEAELGFSGFARPGIECEIAVRLARDIPAADAPHDVASVGATVGAAMAAMELVDDRYGDFKAWPPAALIADDFFQSGAVLGPEVAAWHDLDLKALEGVTRIDGQEAGRGRGAEVMGEPLAALAWLANAFAPLGRDLQAGEFVLLGSLVPVQWLDGPAEVTTEIVGLGKVGLRLT